MSEDTTIALGLLKKEEKLEEERRRMPNRYFYFALSVRKFALCSNVILFYFILFYSIEYSELCAMEIIRVF